jgi:hypothetical protein
MRRRLAKGLLCGALALQAAPAMARAADPLSAMFAWWNRAFTTPDGYTKAAFDRWFTPDATLTINGKTVIHGTAEWASHFRAIQAHGGTVEIVLPFKVVTRRGDRIYTYHVIRSRDASGKSACMLAAGDAVMRHGKIAAITLVRHALDPALGEDDPACFHEARPPAG